MRNLKLWMLGWVVLAAFACQDDGDSSTNDGDLDRDVTTEQEESAPGDEDLAPEVEKELEEMTETQDEAEEEFPDCDGTWLTSVSGTVLNAQGQPQTDARAIVCIFKVSGGEACLNPVAADAEGRFVAVVPSVHGCAEEVAVRVQVALKPGYAIPSCRYEPTQDGAFELPEAIRMVEAPECTRDPLGTVTDAHVITASNDATLTVVPDKLFLLEYGYADMNLLVWDDAGQGWPCFIDPDDPPAMLLAFAPEIEVTDEGGALIAFPNSAALSAGDVVDLYVVGGSGSRNWEDEAVDEGLWTALGTATVSQDGTTIEMNDARGLPFLTWVGFKTR